jgi:microcystin-dependent protein
LGAGDTYAAESTGGEEKHTLTESELPNVTGSVDFQSDGNNQGIVSGAHGVFTLGQISSGAFRPNNRVSEEDIARQFRMSFGSNLPHNNMPPYYSVYIWKRIE